MASPVSATSGAEDEISVFVSYSRVDQKRAMPVIHALEQAGFRVWWDGLLEGGDNFLPTTAAALEGADAVVVLWSKTSVDSHWVRDEATSGRDRHCLVPLSLDGVQPPLGFRQFQVIDIAKWNGRPDAPEMAQLVRAVGLVSSGAARPRPIAPSPAASRRGVLIGGGAVALAAVGGLTAWGTGLIGGRRAAGNSIAVLPFKNLSGDASQDYFSDGLSEELRSALARNRTLRIAAPTSSAGLRDQSADVISVASKLSVANVLRGSVRRDANKLRIAVELIAGKDASIQWSQTFDRLVTDVFAMQSEIANTVAKMLSSEITAQEIAKGISGDRLQLGGTANVAAFEAYLKGKALAEASSDEPSDRAALAQFDAAIKLDPDYASALAARSKILVVIANETSQGAEIRGLFEHAIDSARRGITAAPALAEAHSALGYALYNGRLDPKAAREHYDRSRELGAGDADVLRTYALFCAYTGRAADANAAIESSLSLDPLNPGAFRAAGYISYAARDYPQTIAMMRKALSLNPKMSTANAAIGNALYLTSKYADSIAAFQVEPLEMFKLAGLAIAHHGARNQAAAKAAADQLDACCRANASYQQAQVFAQWGDAKAAMDKLGEAARVRDSGLLLAATDPMLDPLRKQAGFQQLISRQGLS